MDQICEAESITPEAVGEFKCTAGEMFPARLCLHPALDAAVGVRYIRQNLACWLCLFSQITWL